MRTLGAPFSLYHSFVPSSFSRLHNTYKHYSTKLHSFPPHRPSPLAQRLTVVEEGKCSRGSKHVGTPSAKRLLSPPFLTRIKQMSARNNSPWISSRQSAQIPCAVNSATACRSWAPTVTSRDGTYHGSNPPGVLPCPTKRLRCFCAPIFLASRAWKCSVTSTTEIHVARSAVVL